MEKSKLFTLAITLIVSITFLISVSIAYQPNSTQILLGETPEEIHQNEDTESKAVTSKKQSTTSKASAKSSSSSKSSSASKAAASSKAVKSASVPAGAGDPSPSGESQYYQDIPGSHDDYSSDPYSQDSSSDSSEPSSEASESSEDSSGTEEPEPDTEFEAVHQQVLNLKDQFGVFVSINTSDSPFQQENQFHDSVQALCHLEWLEAALNQFPSSFWSGVLQKGFEVYISIESGQQSNVSMSCSGNDIQFSITGGSNNWKQSFSNEMVSAVMHMIGTQTDINTLYANYQALNPWDFVYGNVDFRYVNTIEANTYFWDVEHQIGVEQDFSGLYFALLQNLIPNSYLDASCPLVYKVIYVQDMVSAYIG